MVELVRDGPFALVNADDEALSRGANLAMIGSEAIQFAHVEPLGASRFRLSGLWRGRGGTEDRINSHQADENFVLISEALALVDPAVIGAQPGFDAAAQGRDDPAPVPARLAWYGRAVQPLAPVHGRQRIDGQGGIVLQWTRRSRSGFAWRDGFDVPLAEESEAYHVAIVANGSTIAELVAHEPMVMLDAERLASWRSNAVASLNAAIVQQGALGISAPLIIPLAL